MDRIITSSRDRTSLLSTHKVLRNTYFMLSLTLAFSAITATASTVLMLPSPGLILTLVGMYGLMFLTYKTADKPVGILSAFAFTGFLGYILGPMLEENLRRAMLLSRGDPSVFFNRPISASLLALTGAILLWAIWSGVRKSRRDARALAHASESAVPAAASS